MPNTTRTLDQLNLTDGEVLELLDWLPENDAWRREYILVQDMGFPAGGRSPRPQWIRWARDVLSTASANRQYEEILAGILIAAEALHPQGFKRPRLLESFRALKRLRGNRSDDANDWLKIAEDDGVFRVEKVDRWTTGMPSGAGWRTLCLVTMYGKTLVPRETMPVLFDPPTKDSDQSVAPWRQITPAIIKPPIQIASPPADIVWSAPFVDQQVQKFFRRRWDEYVDAVKAVINGDIEMDRFSLRFGPSRIADWINSTLNVTDESRRCSKQNINNSATYEAMVKSFKRNPHEHIVVKRIEHGSSDEVQSIIDELLLGVAV